VVPFPRSSLVTPRSSSSLTFHLRGRGQVIGLSDLLLRPVIPLRPVFQSFSIPCPFFFYVTPSGPVLCHPDLVLSPLSISSFGRASASYSPLVLPTHEAPLDPGVFPPALDLPPFPPPEESFFHPLKLTSHPVSVPSDLCTCDAFFRRNNDLSPFIRHSASSTLVTLSTP